MRCSWGRTLVLLALLGMAQPLTLGESGESRPEWAEDGRNEFAVFVGVTDSDSDTGPSLGLDYGHRLTRLFGIGGTIEWTGSDLREGLVAVLFNWHAWKELKIFIAPGFEIETAEGDSSAFLVRLGIEYGFDIGKGWDVAPAVNFDFRNGEDAIVIGAGFGKSF